MKANMRLEAENDELAEELNSTRTDLESQLNKVSSQNQVIGHFCLRIVAPIKRSD